MERETVIVPEKKENLERIKAKYKNMEMSDDVAQKIERLEITNKILKVATIGAGIATAINIVTFDGLPFIDEAILGGITALLQTSSTIVKNKINALVQSEDSSLKIEEARDLSEQMVKIANGVKNKINGDKGIN